MLFKYNNNLVWSSKLRIKNFVKLVTAFNKLML